MLGKIKNFYNKDASFFNIFILAVVSQFFLYRFFYGILILFFFVPMLINFILKKKDKLKTELKNPIVIFVLLLFIYIFFLIIFRNSANDVLKTFLTFSFIVGSFMFTKFSANNDKKRLFFYLALSSLIMGIWQFILYIINYPINFPNYYNYTNVRGSNYELIFNLGLDHKRIIIMACLYAFAGISSLFMLLSNKFQKTKFQKYCYLFSYIICGIIILLAQRKGPILSYAICSYIMFFYYKRYIIFSLSTIAGIFILLTVFHLFYPFISQDINNYLMSYKPISFLVLRGDSLRSEVWINASHMIKESFLTGYAFGTKIPCLSAAACTFQKDFIHPHNIFLYTFFYFGIFGFLLFCTIIIASFVKVFKDFKNNFHLFILLLLAILTTITDGEFISIRNIYAWWIILWMVIAFIAGQGYNSKINIKDKK